MSLISSEIDALALHLDQATTAAREVERLTLKQPELSLAEAYRIQDAGVRLRLGRGERQVGLKMGLTSEAKRRQMNLKSPCYGVLTDRMQLEEGAVFSLKGKIHPKIEPEIAFIVAREIRGVPSLEDALNACSGICAAMEILDSRFVGFKYFSLPDVVADNSSSSYFVLGRKLVDPASIARGVDGVASLAQLEMVMKVNGAPVHRAQSSEISGNPVRSLVQLCELLSERGLSLPQGSIVLAGAATQAVQLEAGMKIELEVAQLGNVTLSASS